ncbi:MAG: family 43 glycosylhydrolase [Acetobacteraceae bacterium]|nr:family 43 glycosylhydrolase [Acetobacteraceae bacterium]
MTHLASHMCVSTLFFFGCGASLNAQSPLPTACTDGVTITPGTQPNDDQGQPIQAHGGSIIKAGDRFYWYGEAPRDVTCGAPFGCFTGVNAYSSADLQTWHNEGTVLGPRAGGPLSPELGVAYRPKVLYNAWTQTYVMILTECCATDSPDYNGHLVWATASTPFGPFSYLSASYGANQARTMDVGVFINDNGLAFIVYSDNNDGISIDQLSDDYLSVAMRIAHISNGCEEAPSLIEANNNYYLFNSYCSGWQPNQNHYRIAPSLVGPWSTVPDGNIGDGTTYNSQGGYILAVSGTVSTTYIYIGDRWDWQCAPCTEATAKYVWLPLQLGSSSASMSWLDRWYLDLPTGTWSSDADCTAGGSGHLSPY